MKQCELHLIEGQSGGQVGYEAHSCFGGWRARLTFAPVTGQVVVTDLPAIDLNYDTALLRAKASAQLRYPEAETNPSLGLDLELS